MALKFQEKVSFPNFSFTSLSLFPNQWFKKKRNIYIYNKGDRHLKKQEKYNSTKKKENHYMFPPLKITGTILADVSVFSVHRQYVCLLSIIMYKLFYLLIHLLGLIPLSGQYSTILGHCTVFHLRKIPLFINFPLC